MIINILALVIGFALLIKGADMFVDGAASTAENFKVSKLVIGITIIAFGTSAPEFAISFKALMEHSGDMVLGNVIGSNIINTLLILGITCLFGNITIKNNTVRKEIPFTILMSTLLVILFSDSFFAKNATNIVSRSDGVVILLVFSIFLYYLFTMIRTKTDKNPVEPRFSLSKSIVFTIIGIIGIIIGSDFVVDSASKIATSLGISERIISLTIIALGTSLPELVTSIVSVKKGEQELLVGNIIGSNIFNIGVVLALPVVIFGGISGVGFSYVDLMVFILSSIMLFISAINDRKINKLEGVTMLITFIVYYLYVIFS